MPSISALAKALTGCLLAVSTSAMASTVPFTLESDGSYSYYLTGNTLSLSDPGSLVLGGHDASNHGINLINYENGQIKIGGFFDMNAVSSGNYSTDLGNTFSISTSSNPNFSLSAVDSITTNTTVWPSIGYGFTSYTATVSSPPNPYIILSTTLSAPLSGSETISINCVIFNCYAVHTVDSSIFIPNDPILISGPGTPVPLPPSLALLISGLGMLGLGTRRMAKTA